MFKVAFVTCTGARAGTIPTQHSNAGILERVACATTFLRPMTSNALRRNAEYVMPRVHRKQMVWTSGAMLGEPDLSAEQERTLHDAVCGVIRPIRELASPQVVPCA